MLITDIVRRVREAAGDVEVMQFSNDTLTDWINDGIRECVVENSLLQSRAVTSVVLGQDEYALPENILKIHSIYYGNRKLEALTLEQWEERHANQADAETAEGDPTQFYIYANALTVFPTPNSVGNLTLNYTQLPTKIERTEDPETWTPDEPDINEAFHGRLVTYCLAQVAMQDDDYTKYEALMGEFTTGVRDLRGLKDQEEDLYPFISVSSRDMGEDWWGGDY